MGANISRAAESAAVFLNAQGHDPRTAITGASFPWSAIGQLSHLDSNGILHLCTATLVGPDVLVSAAHCVLDENGKLASVHFKAGLRNGAFLAEADSVQVVAGTLSPELGKGADWAVIRLNQRLGDRLGFMKLSGAGLAKLPLTVSFAGYSADFQEGKLPSLVANCTIHSQFPDSSFAHDCSSDEGASGGPLFQFDSFGGTAILLAVHTRGFSNESFAQYTVSEANIAVMQPALEQTVTNFLAPKSIANPNIGLFVNPQVF